MNITKQQRVSAVEYYLSNNEPLRAAAKRFNVHYLSLYQWVKWYRQGGEANLERKKPYRKPWNLPSLGTEKRIMHLKENDPSLTIRKAKKLLDDLRVDISLKGIWAIWKRYGLAGIPRDKATLSFDIRAFAETRASKTAIDKAQALLNNNLIGEAARIINDLPCCRELTILENIPDALLSLRRKVEKSPALFGNIPFPEYRDRMNRLRHSLERKSLHYSALRIGIEEALALQWMGKPKKMISLIGHLEQKLGNGEPAMKISLKILRGIAYSMLFKIKDARRCIARCNKKLFAAFPFLYLDLVAFCTSTGDFKKAIFFAKQGLREAPTDSKKILSEMLAYLYSIAGDYDASRAHLKQAEEKSGRLGLTSGLVRAQFMVEHGRFTEAADLVQTILRESKKEAVISHLHAISLIQAGIYAAMGNLNQAKNTIKKYIPVLKKSKMLRDICVRNALLGLNLPADALPYPAIRLISLLKVAADTLKEKDYRRAFDYATKNALKGIFHRFLLFFPDTVTSLLARGRATRLPRSLLRLPVFNRKTPVYFIKLLGSLIIYRNGKYLPVRLRPKESSFLIFLSLSVPDKGSAVPLENLQKNFWPDKKNPARTFTHLITRVRKVLGIPAHLLTVAARSGRPALVNFGIYFNADYQEFEQTLLQAKTLERAEQWALAKRDYSRAFALFRGEPFKKMYDRWSEEMRHRILTQLEAEGVALATRCIEHHDINAARTMLLKILNIVPASDAVKKALLAVDRPPSN